MEIIQERLEREFNMTVNYPPCRPYSLRQPSRAESIEYQCAVWNADPTTIDLLRSHLFAHKLSQIGVYWPDHWVVHRQTWQSKPKLSHSDRVELIWNAIGRIWFDFFDKLKPFQGYASLDYHLMDMRESDMVKWMCSNGEKMIALSAIVSRNKAHEWGRIMRKTERADSTPQCLR